MMMTTRSDSPWWSCEHNDPDPDDDNSRAAVDNVVDDRVEHDGAADYYSNIAFHVVVVVIFLAVFVRIYCCYHNSLSFSVVWNVHQLRTMDQGKI